jgi:chemotaxis protein MotB
MAQHKRRGSHPEAEHENHERWLVSYADMITVLMALFIVLFAISQVDVRKFDELRTGLARSFGEPSPILSGGVGPMQDLGQNDTPLDLASQVQGPEGPAGPQLPAPNPEERKAVQAAQRAEAQNNAAAAVREVEDLNAVRARIVKALRKRGLEDSVGFHIDERGLVVTIVTSEVVFPGDRADLQRAGRRILDAIGPAVRGLPNNIQVDGHTNQLNVPTVVYPSAWELSTARASIVVRYLVDKTGVPQLRLSAAGYAGNRPLLDPSHPDAPTRNRRVEIVVLSSQPAEVRALLPIVAGADRSE